MNLAIIGGGSMGLATQRQAIKNKKIDKIWVVDPLKGETLTYLESIGERIDGIIDFSHPHNLPMLLEYLKEKKGKIPLVIGTTGFNDLDRKIIADISFIAPVMESSNYSYGINIIRKLGEKIVSLLGGKADVCIVEKHHTKKRDAPSGTAITLAKALGEGEESIRSIRAGTIPGEHDITFAMEDEVIEVKHTAYSKNIFANGAIEAVLWLEGKQPGLYNVDAMLYT